MYNKHKTYFNWSSGKDAALALHKLQQDKNFSIEKVLTSINSHHNRISMHGVRRELLYAQLEQLDLEAVTLELPEEPTMDEYKNLMVSTVEKLKKDGFTHTGFGDIFLEDLRKYKEEQLEPYGIKCVFPLWKVDTKDVIREFIDSGFKAIVVCINSNLLDKSFVGRVIDHQFVADLPENVDPCGENGEFHTFCFDGPIFKNPVKFVVGEKIKRVYENPSKDSQHDNKDTIGFWFCDLIPKES